MSEFPFFFFFFFFLLLLLLLLFPSLFLILRQRWMPPMGSSSAPLAMTTCTTVTLKFRLPENRAPSVRSSRSLLVHSIASAWGHIIPSSHPSSFLGACAEPRAKQVKYSTWAPSTEDLTQISSNARRCTVPESLLGLVSCFSVVLASTLM